MPQPLYIAHNLHPAYELRYGWTGWPSEGSFPSLPLGPFLRQLSENWKGDNLRLLEHAWASDGISLTFGATPETSPVRIAALAKGRLQHALRVEGKPVAFSRKVSLRSIGHGTRETIEAYVRTQLKRERLADPRFEEGLRKLSFCDPKVDLSCPSSTRSGRYWYNLHLVLVVAGRYRVAWGVGTGDIQDCYRRIARDNGHEISSLSFMPDHVHMALRGNVERSPQEIALAFQNGVAGHMGCRIWEFSYYVGTFSEYTMEAVRSHK